VDFWLLVGRLGRRWYLTIPLFVIAACVALTVSSSVRSSYQADTQVLLAPGNTPNPAGGNPLLLATKSQLDAATQSLLFVLDSPASAAQRRSRAPGADVRFSLVQEAPIVQVSISGPDPATVRQATDVATTQLDDAIRSIEGPLNAAPQSRIDTVQLTPATVVEQHGDEKRVLLGSLIAGLLTAGLVVLAADQVLRRRLERRLTADLDREVGRLTDGLPSAGPRHRPG
jgi:hypothetical protein